MKSKMFGGVMILVLVMLLSGCGDDKTIKFTKGDIKDDFCGVAINSQYCKCAFHTIAKIEAGSTPNPIIDTVKKNTDALGVTLDDLMK